VPAQVQPSRPAPPRPGGGRNDPISRIIIDGRNVQRSLERGSGAGSLPTAALVARLRAAFSPPTEVELILDGHAGGSPFGRVAPGLTVAFSRSRTADDHIAERAGQVYGELGTVGAWAVVVVSDDREVRDQARRSGLRVERTAWLGERLARPAGPAAPRPGATGRPQRGATIGNRSRG
jgi:hypothetical protein